MLSMCHAREMHATLHASIVGDAPKLVVVDRSITGNGVFGLTNHLFTKGLDEIEFDFYRTNFKKAMRDTAKVPFGHGNLSVYLHARVDDSIRRCLKRSRDVEASAYNKPYFQHLECMGLLAILANLSLENPHPQLVLDWRDDTEDPYARFSRIMQGYMSSDLSASPSRVTLARICSSAPATPICSSSSSSSSDVDEEAQVVEGEGLLSPEAARFTSIIDTREVRSEHEFFSYESVCKIFNVLVCNNGDKYAPTHTCIVVPECLTTKPFGGLFSLNFTPIFRAPCGATGAYDRAVYLFESGESISIHQ